MLVDSLDSKNDCETFLNLRILFSAGAKVWDEKAFGLSVPSSILCNKTAPIPYGDTSQASIISSWGQNEQEQSLRLKTFWLFEKLSSLQVPAIFLKLSV